MVDAHEVHLRHLEQREEGDDDFVARAQPGEELVERRAPLLRDPLGDLRHALLDGDALGADLAREVDLRAVDDALKRVEELVEADVGERRGSLRLDRRRAAEEDVAPGDAARAERLGGSLVLLILEQAQDQLRARIGLLLVRLGVVRRGVRVGRQEHLRLDVRERRRHQQVLSRDVEVEVLHHAEVREVPVGDEGDGEVEDLELVLLNQVQEQVERPLEGRQIDDEVGVERLLEFVAHATPPTIKSHSVMRSIIGPMRSQPSGRAMPGSFTKNSRMNRMKE